MKKFRRIGVLTSGGDAPGMNAAIRAVTREALCRGVEVMAIYRGYSGLISGDIKQFSLRDVSNIINHGGTMLYSDRCPEFKTEEGMKKAISICDKFAIDGIVAIGGDGTFRGARDLTLHGIPCVGLPATIDNDIASTDFTIGFDTATNTVVEMIDRLRDTCESHARCNVVEVMGRGAGDIAINTGIASGATAIAIPEIPFDADAVCEKIKNARKIGKRNFIVVVSEGMGPLYSEMLAKKIQERTGVETKFARLAHVVRGGNPTLQDRVLASRMGAFAVEELLAGRSNLVVCDRHNEIISSDISYALVVDKMNKGIAIKDEELRVYSSETLSEMRALAKERQDYIENLYSVAQKINL